METQETNNIKLDYDEKSPITGNVCVIVEADKETNITSYMCMESGFTTTDNMKIDSDIVEKYETRLTELMRECKFEDGDRGLVWYPAFLQMNGIGMLYPIGTSRDDIKWEVCKVVMIVGDERKKYPIPGKEDEYFTSRLDVDNAERFDGDKFDTALDRFYSLAAEAYQELEKQKAE
tara:strand:+ start:26540 stop:27067 length:528 start_codon:yes stop_codon:yes gene_type:complete